MTEGRPRLRLRPAVEADAELLLRWRNDPVTRRWSRNSDEVALDDHVRWLRGVLASDDRVLFVAEEPEATPVGTVRFDRLDAHEWEVSIAVAPEHRGRRLAGLVLAEGERELRRRRSPGTVLATVHRDNAASVALFRSAGYEFADGDADDFLLLRKAVALGDG
ncbi:GNAT family N-acetyltransferase [Saccharomonospora sp. NB11]|jgi:RimJ/RimL family protein N-acetyltransferase|uniref:GNAT family N-acetyltransferase n=1 Tax=Saccharomonospora sp. NB11 TaxID=1642298 RepID=UPI0018D0D462|nr:GNAT family N-acetyltransferase [Saccharomonospora sp. NB11]